MVPLSRIRLAAARIAHRFHPRRIVLFGSHATGRAGRDSDVDLLIVSRTRRPFELEWRILASLRGEFPADILVYTPREIERALRDGDPFLTEILSQGRVLHESRRARVG